MLERYANQYVQTCCCYATVPLTFHYIVVPSNLVVHIVVFMIEELVKTEFNIVIAFTIDEANGRFRFGKLYGNKAHYVIVNFANTLPN